MKKNLAVIPIVISILVLTVSFSVSCTADDVKTDTATTTTTTTTTTTSEQSILNVSAQEAYTLMQNNLDNPEFIILDVRTPDEFSSGHLEGAINIDLNSGVFREKIAELDKNRTYLLYCRSGNRSTSALNIMKELGFSKIYHMNGGILEWNAEKLPTAN